MVVVLVVVAFSLPLRINIWPISVQILCNHHALLFNHTFSFFFPPIISLFLRDRSVNKHGLNVRSQINRLLLIRILLAQSDEYKFHHAPSRIHKGVQPTNQIVSVDPNRRPRSKTQQP